MAINPENALKKRAENFAAKEAEKRLRLENNKRDIEKNIDHKLCITKAKPNESIALDYREYTYPETSFFNGLDEDQYKELIQWVIETYTNAGWDVEYKSNYRTHTFIFKTPIKVITNGNDS